MDLDEIELHDALLINAFVDYEAQAMTITVKYYKGQESKDRTAAKIIFEGVSALNHIGNLDEIARNAFAGHIVYWLPASNGGETYIHLAGGFIGIASRAVKFVDM